MNCAQMPTKWECSQKSDGNIAVLDVNLEVGISKGNPLFLRNMQEKIQDKPNLEEK